MITIDPEDLGDLTTLTTLYAFLVSAKDLADLTGYRQVRADLHALIERVEGHLETVGDRMGLTQFDGSPSGEGGYPAGSSPSPAGQHIDGVDHG